MSDKEKRLKKEERQERINAGALKMGNEEAFEYAHRLTRDKLILNFCQIRDQIENLKDCSKLSWAEKPDILKRRSEVSQEDVKKYLKRGLNQSDAVEMVKQSRAYIARSENISFGEKVKAFLYNMFI